MEVPFSRISTTEPGTKSNVPVTDSLETILNVLNRDQRTILTINRKNRRETPSRRSEDSFPLGSFPRTNTLRERGCGDHVVKSSVQLSCSSGRFFNKTTSRNRSRSRNWAETRFRHLDRLMSRLGEVFIVGVCLLAIVRVPAVMSAPSARYMKTSEQIHSHKSPSTSHSHETEEPPNYMYPCGKNHEEAMNEYYAKTTTTPAELDAEFFKRILIDTKRALSYAESFKNEFVEKTFHLPFNQHHAEWENLMYNWLPNESNEIPKKLSRKVDYSHLKKKSLDKFLVEIFEHLQTFAVALEQVVWDQKRTDGYFVEKFQKTENDLRNVLCGIRMAMIDRNVTPKEHVPRSIMKEDIRQLEPGSFRNLRDWLIFRDLLNCLEYMIEVFTFIEKNLPQSSAVSTS